MDTGKQRRVFVALGASTLLGIAGWLSFSAKAGESDQKPSSETIPASEGSDDLKLLRQAGIGPDDGSLLDFFRNRSATSLQARNIDQLINQLGSDRFAEREQASRALVSAGLAALPQLRLALKADDREVVQRAQICIEQIRQNADSLDLPFAALRVVVRQGPREAVAALLQYLAVVNHDELKVAIWYGLDTLAVRDGRVDPALLAAVKDSAPARRAAAACILGYQGTASERAAVHQCLTDADPEVRLRAAQGLLAANDKAAIPVLIELLDQPAIALAWQAEELLHWFAGTTSPSEVVGVGTPEARKRCWLAWMAWWKEKGAYLDPFRSRPIPQRPCLLLICEPGEAPDRNFPTRRHGRVFLCGSDGRSRWQIPDLVTPVDVELLPGNRLLIAEEAANRLTERDLKGRVVREYPMDGPKSFRRDAAGVSVVSQGRPALVCRFGSDSTCLYRQAFPLFDQSTCELDGARLLANGHLQYLYHLQTDEEKELIFEENADGTLRARPSGFRRAESLVETDPASGKEYTSARFTGPCIWLQGLDSYGNNHLLLAQGGEVVQVDPAGRARWRAPLPVAQPASAVRLPTGNILIAGNDDWHAGLVTEIDRTGKTKWEAGAESALSCPRNSFPLIGLGFARHQPPGWDLNALDLRVKALKDSSSLVRRRSLAAIKRKGPAAVKALPAVLEAFDDPEDPGIREKVRQILAGIGPDALPFLGAALKDPRPSIRAGAAGTFGLLSKQATPYIPSLIAALKDKDCKVRWDAAWALGKFGASAKPAVPDLVQMLKDGRNNQGLQTIVESLEEIGPEAHEAVPELLHLLKREDGGPRASVIRALERIGPRAKAAVPVLIKELRTSPSEFYGGLVADVLGAIGPDARDAIPVLVEILKGRAPHCKSHAARALGKIGAEPKTVIPALILALDDPREVTILEATLALEKFGGTARDAVPALKKALKRTANERMRARLESCLETILSSR